MCGIGGFQGDFAPGLLDLMNDIMEHRGPDNCGIYHDPEASTGLSHRRLSIIDLSKAGSQPMEDVTKTCLITFNGEIYNYLELRHGLVLDGFEFRSKSDTETLLNLYLRDGYDMLRKLNGIFSFAIFDTRDSTLFLVRDGFGVKPLYFSSTPKGFLFASEIKALLLEPSVSRDLNHKSLHYHLTYLWSPAPATMLENVHKLEPGSALLVKNGVVARKWTFYRIPTSKGSERISVNQAAYQVRQSLETAVKRQMVADVPVGAFLSGGLDSSAISAFARYYVSGSQRLQCFTINAPGYCDEGFVDDLPYARKVAKLLGVDLHVIDICSDVVNDLERMIYSLDEPTADLAAINVLYIASLARAQGIKVLLSGAGGDDVFSGYRRHQALCVHKYWDAVPVGIRRLVENVVANTSFQSPVIRRLKKFLGPGFLTGDFRTASHFKWIDSETETGLYSEWIRTSIGNEPFPDPLMLSLSELEPEIPDLHRMLYLDQKHFLIDHNLNYTDKMSMAVGVETRVPFLDPDLVSLAAKLPPSMKQHGLTGKFVLKKALSGLLPPEIINRPKTGFGVPLRRWIKHDLSELINDCLSYDSIKKRGLFDPVGVTNLLELNRSGQVDGSYTILALICIEVWCRIFLDKPMPSL